MDRIDKIESDEITVKELMSKFKSLLRYIKSRRSVLIWFSILGALIGLTYSILQKPIYKATSTFVLEESGRGGSALGQYAALASLADIDIGSGNSKGLFQGDNILELYKSRLMLEKTLLSPVTINNKSQLLIEQYISDNKTNLPWKKDDAESLKFNGDPKKFSRKQDSILRDIIKNINKNILTVTKPDKKLSIISVEVRFKDEVFASLFNQALVQNVNDFYIQTQTRKTSQGVRILQHQADSVRSILNNSIGKVAATNDENPNPNPTLHSLFVPYQKKQIDVQANTAIYSEIVKSLEASKISLRQETPLIQLIDEPIIPLEIERTGKFTGAFFGLIFGFFFSLIYVALGRFYIFFKNS